MLDKSELQQAEELLAHYKWRGAIRGSTAGGIGYGILYLINWYLMSSESNLIESYDQVSYGKIIDQYFTVFCKDSNPIDNVCDLSKISARVCLEAAEDLCQSSHYYNYGSYLVMFLMFVAFAASISFVAIKPLRELFPVRSLKDMPEQERDLVLEVAMKYGLAINNETNVSEAYSILVAYKDKIVINERSGLFSGQPRDYQTNKNKEDDIEILYNRL